MYITGDAACFIVGRMRYFMSRPNHAEEHQSDVMMASYPVLQILLAVDRACCVV